MVFETFANAKKSVLFACGFFVIVLLVLSGCNKNPVQVEKPPLILTIEGKSEVRINETVKIRILADSVSMRDVRYIWIFDSLSPDTTVEFTRYMTWSLPDTGVHLLVVSAFDMDSIIAKPETLVVRVTCSFPNVDIGQADTTIESDDTLYIRPVASDQDGNVVSIQWQIDKDTLWYSTGVVERAFFWDRLQNGNHVIRIRSVDNDNLVSLADSVLITVVTTPDIIRILEIDTTVVLHQKITLHTEVSGYKTIIKKYIWAIDNKIQYSDSAGEIDLLFGVRDTGIHTITVTAFDKDSFTINTDTITIRVLPGYPKISLPSDTVLSSIDSIRITAVASDSNGTIVSYGWSYDGVQNMSTDSSITLTYSGKASVRVTVKATDNDGLSVSDTMVITFNTPPVFKLIKMPSDTLFCSEKRPIADAFFQYTSFDYDNDACTITCFIRAYGSDSLKEYSCGKDSVWITVGGPGKYYITLTCKDSFGNVVTINDSVFVIENHTICFAGHSIVCGLAGDGLHGGFRAKVLAGLRENLLPGHAIKAFGPITTPGDMKAFPEDDSCFAISGSIGRSMHNLVQVAYKTLSADIWVLMLGANASYSTIELGHTISLMDTMLARNPDARIYMITSPPFPDKDYTYYSANYYLERFYNPGIRDSVTSRIAQGYHVSVVEAATLLSEPDSTFDSTWFSDHVHPNAQGYDRLGAEILRVMKLKENPAIKKELYELLTVSK